MQRRHKTLILASGVSNLPLPSLLRPLPYNYHSFFLIPVTNTFSRCSSSYISPFPSSPSGGGIMNSNMHKKISNDSKIIKIQRFDYFLVVKLGQLI